jgi:L-fuconolactonase
MMPDFPIIDSHVHLADPQRFSYGWTRNAPSLNRRVMPADLMKAATPVQIERIVFVEVDVDLPQYLAEAEWIDDLSRIQPKEEPRIAGVVAALPLERGKAVAPELVALLENRSLRGIRRLIQNQADPDFCIQPDFIEGLKLLAAPDLVFDICIFHHHFPNAIRMVQQCPEVRFVLDHIGKPGIKAGLMDPWRQHMKELAACPNVTCKISGVTTEADHANWTREQIKPYVAHAIESFGFDRVMYGGDWHVMELAGTYPQWVEIVDWVVESATPEEKRKLYRDNAIRTYRLD